MRSKHPSKSQPLTRALLAAIAALAMTACAGNSATPAGTALPPLTLRESGHASSRYVKHVIVMIQENRSLNDFFATFPGADGTTVGEMKTPSGPKSYKLHEANLVEICDFGHSYEGYLEDYDGGKMDGFNLEGGGGKCKGSKAGRRPYQYVNPSQIAPYWDIAGQYVLANHFFQTQGSGSFTAHQDLIRGATTIDPSENESLVDSPTSRPWGCDAKPGTVTSFLKWTGSVIQYRGGAGPFPCTKDFAPSENYDTLRDLLDAKSVSWKYYSPAVKNGVGGYWNAFDMIAAVRYGPEWGTNVTTSPPFEKAIFSDIQYQRLAAVSWLIPDSTNSDHPGDASDTGPSWIASVVNAIGESPYWKNTAIVVVWDDWGGFYDNVPPPFFDHWGGLGFRVPMLLISTYARKGTESQGGHVSQTQYEFGSILKFIENNWDLGSLGTTDARAHSIVDCFNFKQPPRSFSAIPSKYSRAYFERQSESYKPVDTE